MLGLDADRSPEALRKAKRAKVLAVHPDKLPQGTPGCEQAFQRVQTVCLGWGLYEAPHRSIHAACKTCRVYAWQVVVAAGAPWAKVLSLG